VLNREYELAAQYKTQRLQLQAEYDNHYAQWRQEKHIDEVVDENDIAEVVAKWTGIPMTQMLESEAEKLLRMEDALHERIIGQDEAIVAVSDAIRRARSGLKDPKRPIGSFIFLGSSGVGKTELAKALAQFMFDDEDALLRIDMSEYREQHTASRMFGAPPGYVGYEEGGQLTEAVRRRPYRVILFDEIEKAHPEVWNSLLQILDDGRLTDGQGRVVDFRNTVIIMTSNLGTQFARRGGTLGFVSTKDPELAADQEKIEKALRDTFRPEFLNRIDEIIIFSPLSVEEVGQIVTLQMAEIQERMNEQGLTVELTDAARFWLASEGYDAAFGARPLKRALQKYVESPLSIQLLRGDFPAGTHVIVDATDEDGVIFRSAGIPADIDANIAAE
jgi:ATP-dependent Clp protease ATP-binding subunit ClpC